MHPEDIDDDALLASNPFWDCENCGEQNSRLDGECQFCPDEGPSEEMDGDHGSALASAGMGTDEDYGSFGAEDSWLDGSYEDA